MIVTTTAAAAALAVMTQAAPVAPPRDVMQITAKPTLGSAPSRSAFLGHTKINLEKTTLSDVLKTVKKGAIYHSGDAGNSVYWLCYTLKNEFSYTRVWLLSDGEMGGAEHSITSIHAALIRKSGKNIGTAGCPILPLAYEAIILEKGIQIGIRRDEVLKRLGKPTVNQSGWLVFFYEGKAKPENVADSTGATDEQYTEDNILQIKIIDGIVSEFNVSKITSN